MLQGRDCKEMMITKLQRERRSLTHENCVLYINCMNMIGGISAGIGPFQHSVLYLMFEYYSYPFDLLFITEENLIQLYFQLHAII